MADVQDQNNSTGEPVVNHDLEQLKKDLEGWREILLPMNSVIQWDKPHYPAILVGLITFIFSIIWYFEPSILTTFSLIGFLACLLDFLVPTIVSTLFSTNSWTFTQERQFENVCIRIHNAKVHLFNVKNALNILKNDKPKVYLLVMMGSLAVLAWIGSLIDNLLLTYFVITFMLLLPGLRRHGIIQRFTGGFMAIMRRLVLGKDKAKKN